MKKLRFKPRATFNADLKLLVSLDRNIIDEVRAAIDLLLKTHQLPPPKFDNHELTRRLTGYHEFHLSDTPPGNQPNDVRACF